MANNLYNTQVSPKGYKRGGGVKKPGKVNKYTVKFDGLYSCTCLGYTYRRKCRHITELSNSFGLKKGN